LCVDDDSRLYYCWLCNNLPLREYKKLPYLTLSPSTHLYNLPSTCQFNHPSITLYHPSIHPTACPSPLHTTIHTTTPPESDLRRTRASVTRCSCPRRARMRVLQVSRLLEASRACSLWEQAASSLPAPSCILSSLSICLCTSSPSCGGGRPQQHRQGMGVSLLSVGNSGIPGRPDSPARPKVQRNRREVFGRRGPGAGWSPRA